MTDGADRYRPRRGRGQADEVGAAEDAASAAGPDPARSRPRRDVEPCGRRPSVVVVGHGADQMTGHLADVAPDATTVLQDAAAGHRARRPGRPGRGRRRPRHRRHRQRRRAAAAAADAGRAGRGPRGGRCGGHDPDGGGRRPVRAGSDHPRSRAPARSTRSSRSATPRRRSGPSRRSTPGCTPSTPPCSRQVLGKLTTHNEQGEEYLTDVIGLLVDSGRTVRRACHGRPDRGARLQRPGRAGRAARASCATGSTTAWMRAGVTIVDPATTWIDVTVAPGPRHGGRAQHPPARRAPTIGAGAVVGPDTTLDRRARSGEGATGGPGARRRGRASAPRARVGPYAYLRPGTVLHERAKVGTFVEVKNSEVGCRDARSRICPMWATPPSARRPTSARPTWSSTTTGWPSTARSSVPTCGPGSDTMFVAPVDGRRRRVHGRRQRHHARTCRRERSASAGREQRNVEGWVAATARRHQGGRAAAAARGPDDGSRPDSTGERASHARTSADGHRLGQG